MIMDGVCHKLYFTASDGNWGSPHLQKQGLAVGPQCLSLWERAWVLHPSEVWVVHQEQTFLSALQPFPGDDIFTVNWSCSHSNNFPVFTLNSSTYGSSKCAAWWSLLLVQSRAAEAYWEMILFCNDAWQDHLGGDAVTSCTSDKVDEVKDSSSAVTSLFVNAWVCCAAQLASSPCHFCALCSFSIQGRSTPPIFPCLLRFL